MPHKQQSQTVTGLTSAAAGGPASGRGMGENVTATSSNLECAPIWKASWLAGELKAG